ncbi:cell surface protein, partial [Mycobacterium sp. ITM-2017-0098]
MIVNLKSLAGAGFAMTAAVGLSLGMATTASAAPVGPGCAAYAQQVPNGPGSVQGMAAAPVATAAASNPILTTLTKAVSGQLNPNVNLVDTLNGAEFT